VRRIKSTVYITLIPALSLEGEGADTCERSLIQTQFTLGFKPSWIAESLGLSVSTITRELRCNGWERPVVKPDRGRPPIAGKYRAVLAQARAVKTSAKPRVERRLQVGNAFWPRL
jgi:transposase, IS30 family